MSIANAADRLEGGHGKKQGQKLKPYLVMQYLLKTTDEQRCTSAEEIVKYLRETCGIYAERRSIYSDIKEINKAVLMLERETNLAQAARLLEQKRAEGLIVYDKSKKGFRVSTSETRLCETPSARRNADSPKISPKHFFESDKKKTTVRIIFVNDLYNTVAECLGVEKMQYATMGDEHFIVTAAVPCDEQFYSWLFRFGRKAKLLAPDSAVEEYKTFLDRVRSLY